MKEILKRLFKRKCYFIVVYIRTYESSIYSDTFGKIQRFGNFPKMDDLHNYIGLDSAVLTNIIELNEKDFSDYFSIKK